MSPNFGGGTGTPTVLPSAPVTGIGQCTGRYADAIDFAAFFCVAGGYIKSIDNGGGAGVPMLTDTQVDFFKLGAKAGEGMLLYNVTTGYVGPVTAVTEHTLTATGVVWSNGNVYRFSSLDVSERSTIEGYLDITAADISAALASVGACTCTLAAWAWELLKKINIIEAAAFYVCPCARPNLTDVRKAAFITWANEQFTLIRTGDIELCQGDTGSKFPAAGVIEYSNTMWNAAQIIINDTDRKSGVP